jgi:uncharacterized membrane protein YdjX (TVP38/TMEM64 family)
LDGWNARPDRVLMPDSRSQIPQPRFLTSLKCFLSFRRTWAALVLLPLAAWLAWRLGPLLWVLLHDEAALEAFVARLGWWGPLALIAMNALQIVVAPIPGYVIQAAAGFLFGPLWGGIWASLGALCGGMLAMLLTRLYGRPLAERLVGGERLARWEAATLGDSAVVWWLILMAPVGDMPYHLAGLARVGFAKILILTFITRVPTVFLVAAAGAGVLALPWWQLALLFLVFLLAWWLVSRHREWVTNWIDRQVRRRLG